MVLVRHVAVVLILSLTPAWGIGAEELSADSLVIQAEIPKAGDFMGFGFDSLWMMSARRLVRVNAFDNSIVDIDIGDGPGKSRVIAIGEGAVWVAAPGRKRLLKVDAIANKLVLQIPAQMLDNEGSIGAGEGGVWVITSKGGADQELTRFNPSSGAVDAVIPLPSISAGVVVDFGSVWVTGVRAGELYRVDPKTNSVVSTIKLHDGPRFITSGENSIWVLNGDGTVQRIDGNAGDVLATIETGSSGSGGDIVCGGGFVWVTAPGVPVAQIDPKTNTLVRLFRGGGMGDAIRYGAGSLWVSGSAIHRIEPPR
jgi:streptogramin lyase